MCVLAISLKHILYEDSKNYNKKQFFIFSNHNLLLQHIKEFENLIHGWKITEIS